MGSNLLEFRVEPKFALQNFEKGCSVLVEKMHTPETKSTIFQKNACSGRLSCIFMHTIVTYFQTF